MRKPYSKNLSFNKKFLCSFLLFFLVGQFISAQNKVNGTVYDVNNLPLPGVNVIEKGTTNGVVTDFDGNYSITINDGAFLVFSYLGFVTQEISVDNRVSLNVTLKESFENLSEVVVIGYGSQLKEEISGSVSSVEAEDIENIPQVSIDQLLQGRAAGVSVTQNSGQPGSAVSVRIRGVNSITGSSEPLYIIDGVPISGDSNNVGTSGRSIADNGLGEDAGSTGVSPLSAINPNDIESVDILKDASATAIYGSRGSNGVVTVSYTHLTLPTTPYV